MAYKYKITVIKGSDILPVDKPDNISVLGYQQLSGTNENESIQIPYYNFAENIIKNVNGGYKGVAKPDTIPDDTQGYWNTVTSGIYKNFDNIEIPDGYTIIYYDRDAEKWSFQTTGIDPNIPILDTDFFSNIRSISTGQPIQVGKTWTNILSSVTGENLNYEVVTVWYDGSQMDDTKTDGIIYRKRGTEYLKLVYDGSINIKMFGASPSLAANENKAIIDNAIKIINKAGGGKLIIPYDINYGYNRYDITTLPNTSDVNNDIIVEDYSIGNSYAAEAARDGAQLRYFYGSKGNVQDGQHDGEGYWMRGAWHPYLMISNDEDPLKAYRRMATLFFATNGIANWGIGQGVNGSTPDGTDRDIAMSDFKIVSIGIDGGSPLTSVMVIKMDTGRWGFNTNAPVGDYHFACRRNSSSSAGTIYFENKKTGNLQLLFATLNQSRRIILDESTGNLNIVSANGSIKTRLLADGSIQISNTSLLYGDGDPNDNDISAPIGSLYFNESPQAPNTGLYVRRINGSGGWRQLRGVDSGVTASRPSLTSLPVGATYFDTTLNKPVWWNGSNWVDSAGTIV